MRNAWMGPGYRPFLRTAAACHLCCCPAAKPQPIPARRMTAVWWSWTGPRLTAFSRRRCCPTAQSPWAANGFLTLDGQSNPAVGAGQVVTNLTRTDLSLYYVDGADLSVYYSDLTGSSVRWLLSLDDAVDGHKLTSLSLASGGNVLLLLDGHTLCLAGESGVTTLHGVLYPTAVRSAVMLALFGLAALVLAGIVWYAACGRQRGWVPLALQWGCFLVALALVSGMVLQRSILLPQRQRETGETYAQVVDSAVQLALTEGNLSDETLPETLAHALEEVQGGVFRMWRSPPRRSRAAGT